MSGPKTGTPAFSLPQQRQDIASTRPSHPTSNGAATPGTILIYEALILLLKDACRAGSQSLSEVAGVQETLDIYPLSDSAVSSIVESLQCRKTLLELAFKLGLAHDPRLRSALHLGEKRIAALLVSIFNDNSEEDAVLQLRGDSAQYFLDVVQDTLDRGFLMAQEHSRMARRIVRKLSETCDQLPSSIFISGVTGREEYYTFGGGFGDIYRASCGGQVVALKYMRAVNLLRGDELRRLRSKFCREALVWKDLHHPYILPFMGIDRDSYPSSLCMVSPWMEHRTVLNYLKDHGRGDVDKLLYEIAQGLEYLHSHDIVHGDLRGSNILITQDWSACLADFGLSAFTDATSSLHTSSNRAGSLNWMAPELLDPGRFFLKFSRTPASDVYAFGCVCFELYTGRPPFAELGPAALMKVIAGERPERPSDAPLMSDALWQHVSGYWAQSPDNRPVSSIVVQNMVWPILGSKTRRPLAKKRPSLSGPSTISARGNTAPRSIRDTTSVSPVDASPGRTLPGESSVWFSTNDDEIGRDRSQRRIQHHTHPKHPSVQDIVTSFNSPPAPGLARALPNNESDDSHAVPERDHAKYGRKRGRGKGKERRREDDTDVVSPLTVLTDHLVDDTSWRSPLSKDMLRLQSETRPLLPAPRLNDTHPGLQSRSASDTPYLRHQTTMSARSRVRSTSFGAIPRLYEAKSPTDYDGGLGSDAMNVAFIAGALAHPAVKVIAIVAPIPGMDMALSLVEKIFAVMEQMRYNKTQCRRLAEAARDAVEAVEEALAGITEEEVDANLLSNVDKLVRTLKRTADQLREIAGLNFVKRLLQYTSIEDELVVLDREIQEATTHFMLNFAPIDAKRHQLQNEKARRDDQKAMMDELKCVVKDQDELAQRIGLRGGKLDSDSQNAIQVILHRIDHEPEKVPEEVKTFAEGTSKTIKARTNIEAPRTLPWFVKTRDIKRGVKIGSGGFSVVYKGRWLTRDMDVAVKVFRGNDNVINELLDEVFIWRSFSHPNLHPFLGAAPFEQPAFVVSPFCANGNALDYLAKNPNADEMQILYDIGRGMEYLHGQNVVHGDLKARNVLINDEGRALVADFGLAKFERVTVKSAVAQLGPDSTPTKPKTLNLVGTLHWLAPECFRDGEITKSTDTWAMGMCAYELFTDGKVPLVEIAPDDLGERLADGARPRHVDAIPKSAWTIMERCWAHEPVTRPTFSQLCLVLGVFQDSDIESLQEASQGFAGEHWSGSELSGWPGLTERLIAILTSVLKIGPVQSIAENVGAAEGLKFSLSPQSQGRVVSALRVLVTLARSSGDDVSVGEILVSAGALPALLFILQRTQLDPEILQLGCEILDGLSEGYANETLAIAIASSDFIRVLIKLAGETEIQTARKALDTAGKLVVSKRSLEEEAEKKQRAISLGIIPRLLEVFGRKDAVDAIIEACNFSCMLALPPVALSDEHVGDILSALVPLVPHTIPDVRRSVLETVKVVLFCSSSTSLPVVKCGELANVILDLIEHYDHETPVAMAQATLEILSRIATKSNIPKLLALLRTVHDTNALLVTVGILKNVGSGYNTEEKNELAKTHDIFTTLTPLLKSPEEVVSTWTGEAVSAFSTAQNIPLFITFLQGDDERLKLMSVRILKELTGGLSEAEKLAVVRSGVLSDLHYLLQKSPGEPSKPEDVVDAGFDDESEPASEPSVPDSTTDGPSPDGSAPSKLDDAATPDKKEREPLADRKEEGRTATASDPVVETNATVIKQPVNNVVPLRKATVDRAIELRDSAFQILDSIATSASDHGMEIIADAYVKTGIHTSLVGLLKESAHDPTLPGENTRNCIFVLQELARGTDFAKREIIKTDIFREVRRIMDVARGSALRWCCLLVYNLLSSEEVNEDIVLAVLNAEMLERLVANVKKTNDNWRDEWDLDWQPRSAAQALSCLLLSSRDFTWDKLREHDAITCLREFLNSLELVESLFAFRTWMLVEYLEHPQVEAQKFGLLLVNWLLKGGISQRKSVTNTAGMRDALERCLKSEDVEVKAQAGELIAKLPNQSRRR